MIRQIATGSAVAALILGLSPAPASAAPAPISWTPCADGFQCATVSAPLDYDKPCGKQITIALTRMRATDPQRRIGSRVVNPGTALGAVFNAATWPDLAYPPSPAAEPAGVSR